MQTSETVFIYSNVLTVRLYYDLLIHATQHGAQFRMSLHS